MTPEDIFWVGVFIGVILVAFVLIIASIIGVILEL